MHKKRYLLKENKKKIPFLVNNNGLSEIVATLILILLVLVATAVIWVVIQGIISGSTSQINLNQFTFSMSIKSAYVSGTDVVVTVSRNSGGGSLNGIKFVFVNNTGSISVDENISLNVLNTKSFTFTSSQIPGIGAGDTVSVAPIYLVSGQQTVGNPMDTAIISGTPPSGSGTPVSGAVCGNGILEAGEQCDDGNTVNGDGCSSLCTIETASPSCNNDNVIDSGELCDGTSLGGKTCQSFGYNNGTLLCNNQCGFDISQCTFTGSFCGDGIVNPGEQCDTNNLNGKNCINLGLGFVGGTLSCNPQGTQGQCQFNTSQCVQPTPPSCNGTWVPPEDQGVVCDGGAKCLPTCTCPTGFTPDGSGGCKILPPVNNGIINSVWNNIFFDSQNLPKNRDNVTNYIGDYVNFSSSPETRCFQINFADYIPDNNISYLRLDNSNGTANISSGQGYSVWQALNCGQ